MRSFAVRSIVVAAVAVVAAVLGSAVAVLAQDAPAIPKDVTVISNEQLKKMIDGKEKFLLVDARNGSE
jgi:hypothetical protein